MSSSVTLIGAEDVARAGHNISGAADQMQRAASTMEGAAERMARSLEDASIRIMQAMEDSPAMKRLDDLMTRCREEAHTPTYADLLAVRGAQ